LSSGTYGKFAWSKYKQPANYPSVDEIAPVAYKMPEYMATHEPDSIFNPKQSPFSWGNDAEGTTFYEFLLSHPDRLKRFNVAMTTQEAALPVLGMFPFTSLLETNADPSRAFIVDVAGGRGQSLLQIKKEIETVGGHMEKGRVILQDRKPVLDAVPDEKLPGVEKMVIDFFTPQPVKSKIPLLRLRYLLLIGNRRTNLLPPPNNAQLAG
jgi:hypothetical protein